MLPIILSHSGIFGPVRSAMAYPFFPRLIVACGSCVLHHGVHLSINAYCLHMPRLRKHIEGFNTFYHIFSALAKAFAVAIVSISSGRNQATESIGRICATALRRTDVPITTSNHLIIHAVQRLHKMQGRAMTPIKRIFLVFLNSFFRVMPYLNSAAISSEMAMMSRGILKPCSFAYSARFFSLFNG